MERENPEVQIIEAHVFHKAREAGGCLKLHACGYLGLPSAVSKGLNPVAWIQILLVPITPHHCGILDDAERRAGILLFPSAPGCALLMTARLSSLLLVFFSRC